MATQRYISTSFWDDDWIQTLDPSEKLLFLYYMTCPLSTIAGIYKITVRRVSFDTGFNIDTINHIMQKFQKAGKVYRIDEYIVLPNWPKYQKWEKSSQIKSGIEAVLSELPDEVKNELIKIGYTYPIYTPQIPPIGVSSYSDSDLDSDLDLDLNTMSGSEDETPTPLPVKTHQRFVPPSLDDVTGYCRERRNGINPEQFIDFYASKGWMIGKNKMKDWRAAVRTWEKSERRDKPAADRPELKERTCGYCSAVLPGTVSSCSRCGWRVGDVVEENREWYEENLKKRLQSPESVVH